MTDKQDKPNNLLKKVLLLREELTDFKERNKLLQERCRELEKENHSLKLEIKDMKFTRKYLTSEEAGKQFARELLGGN